MSRSCPKFVRKSTSLAADSTTVAQAAIQRTAHRLLRRLDVSVELGESLLLRADQAERLSEFQRWHVNEPALCLTDARSVVCPVLDTSARTMRTRNGQPITIRIILEVASRREAITTRGAARVRVRWYFIVWNDRGHIAHMSTYRTRKAALSMFNRPAQRIAISHNGNLVERLTSSTLDGEGAYHA